jgi:acetyl esterase/lipase
VKRLRESLPAAAVLLFAASVLASAQPGPPGGRPGAGPPPGASPKTATRTPDLENVSYGPHGRNVLDLWKAKSAKPTPLVVHIHGGGFVGGNKRQIAELLLEGCLSNGISVASIDYRLTSDATFPDMMLDAARALQFLRLHAAEWNLDPKAVALTGSSAGGHISLWLAFHDDLADPASADPVQRQSTRVSSVGGINAQTVFDPRVLTRIIGETAARTPEEIRFYPLRPDEMNTEKAFRLFAEASPSAHLSAGDPPVFLYYTFPNDPPTPDMPRVQAIHHPRFGVYLKDLMDQQGIECTLRFKDDMPEPKQYYGAMIDFFVKHFPPPR